MIKTLLMKVTYYGHGCFMIETSGTTFLVDPFISGNPLAQHIDIDSISCEYILLTHGHGDHVADVERVVKNTGALIISNFEVIEWFGAKEMKGHPLNHGGWWTYPTGRIKYVNAVHSSVMPDGKSGGSPGGFVIEGADATLYVSGDTALTMDMQLIPMTCKSLDVAILCIGDNFTMGFEDAVIASEFVQCDKIIGAHYDSFDIIKIDHEKAIQAFSTKNKTLHLLEVGESMDV